jgi:hypothetical protein
VTFRIKRINAQAGSLHVVIVIALVLSLACALGFIFWQNFLRNDATKTVADSTSKTVEEVVIRKKTACFNLEKLCFDYPDDWTASLSVKTVNDITSDTVEVVSENGFKLRADTGIFGIGGTCIAEEAGNVEVIEAKRLGISYALPDDRGAYEAPDVYAAKVIYANKATTEFSASVLLTTDLDLTQAGEVNGCDATYASLFRTRYINHDDNPSNKTLMSFSDTKVGIGSDATKSTAADARRELESDDYKQAYEILASARYE